MVSQTQIANVSIGPVGDKGSRLTKAYVPATTIQKRMKSAAFKQFSDPNISSAVSQGCSRAGGGQEFPGGIQQAPLPCPAASFLYVNLQYKISLV